VITKCVLKRRLVTKIPIDGSHNTTVRKKYGGLLQSRMMTQFTIIARAIHPTVHNLLESGLVVPTPRGHEWFGEPRVLEKSGAGGPRAAAAIRRR
jgi:hypothetical protein